MCFGARLFGCTRCVLPRQMPRAAKRRHAPAPSPGRRLVVALVGLASVATVLLPSGYLDPVVKRAGSALVQSVTAAPLDCAMDDGEMAGMQMPMPADCASR